MLRTIPLAIAYPGVLLLNRIDGFAPAVLALKTRLLPERITALPPVSNTSRLSANGPRLLVLLTAVVVFWKMRL